MMVETEIIQDDRHIRPMGSLQRGEYGIITDEEYRDTIVVGLYKGYAAINNNGVMWDEDCNLNVRKLNSCVIKLYI